VWAAVTTQAPSSGASTPAAPLPATSGLLPPATEAELPSLIVQTIDLRAQNGGGEARVRLRPEYLGELMVKVTVERGIVTAELQAESSQVREWIERNELSLRQALGEHGLTLGELIISEKESQETLGRDRRGEAQRHDQPHQRSPRPRRTNADGSETTFEVVA
jgi:flagellar hook-length control protein FliK